MGGVVDAGQTDGVRAACCRYCYRRCERQTYEYMPISVVIYLHLAATSEGSSRLVKYTPEGTCTSLPGIQTPLTTIWRPTCVPQEQYVLQRPASGRLTTRQCRDVCITRQLHQQLDYQTAIPTAGRTTGPPSGTVCITAAYIGPTLYYSDPRQCRDVFTTRQLHQQLDKHQICSIGSS